jgi:hypothetical protein
MRLSRLSVSACAFAAFMVAGLAVGSGQAPAPQTQKPAPPPRPPLLHGGNLIMPPDDAIAANGGPVFGLASNPGFYITRNVFRNNNTSRPHYHTMDRWVTVIKGTWYGGTGKVFRPKEMKPMPAGSVMYHPAYFIHYDGNQDGGETIVQIQGYGPVATVQVEEDEKGNPISKGGEGAGYATTPPAK